jgi:putative acetyltransferase
VAETVRIRAREPRDAEAIAEIFACPRVIAGTLQLPWRPVEATRERLARHGSETHGLVAEIDGRVVGTLSLHVEANPRRRHSAGIGMGVHDEFQGRGVGSALLTAAIALGDDWLGLRRIELTVYVDNARAIRLYERHGFEIEGTARDFAFRDGAFVDAHTMARLRR